MMLFRERKEALPWNLEKVERSNVGRPADYGHVCQERKEWGRRCKEGVGELARSRRHVICAASRASYACQCGRTFHRQGDFIRHRKFCSLR